ncbi:MAG: hypothetical protein ACYSWP_25150 [Planctomycetota bacterium]|jgi:hypothetical protein
MKILTEHHFDLTYRFLEVQGLHLLKALSENGINDQNQIRSILSAFLFGLAEDLDESFIRDKELGDSPFYPTVCFRDRENIDESEELVIPDGEDLFHETMPFGIEDDLFELGEGKLGFTYGNEDCQQQL